MKYKDYKIGNLVKFEGKIYEIDCVAKDAPFLNTIEFGVGVVTWDNIEPIPLNAELAAEILDDNDNNNFYIRYNKSCGMWVIFNRRKLIKLDSIPYVHQLQNLYFALVGHELTINL